MRLYDMAEGVCCSEYQARGCRPLLAVITGSEYSVRVDCGASPAHRWEYERLYLHTHPAPDIRRTILTHGHWDHFAGGKGDAELIMSEAAWDAICAQKNGTAHSFSRNGMLAEYGTDALPEDIWQGCLPDKLLGTDNSIMEYNLGRRRVRLHVLDSDHAAGNILVEVVEDGIVFIGDALYLGEEDDIWFYTPRIHSIIDYMERLDAKMYVGSHREPMAKKELTQFGRRLLRLSELADGVCTEMMMKKRYAAKYGKMPESGSLKELMWFVNGNRRILYEGKSDRIGADRH